MSSRLAAIRREIDNPAGHGNAGLSNFIDLAHAKVKAGGTIALILPIVAIQGFSWKPARDLLVKHYSKIAVVTISAAGSHDRAFSADTGIAEALVIATKRHKETDLDREALFVNLNRRPTTLLEAAEAAKLVGRLSEVSLTGRIYAGDQVLGSYIRAPLNEGGCAAIRESALAATMIALRRGELRVPRDRNHHTYHPSRSNR